MKISQLFTAAALLVATTTSAAQADVSTVRVGYLANIVFPQPLLGIEQGEFSKRVKGVKFVGKVYPAGPEVLEALRAGVIDVAYTGPFPPLKAFVKSGDVVLLGASAKGGTELSVKANSPIRNVAGLKGKTVGVNQFGSTVDAQVRYAILNAGLAPDRDVKIIEVEPAQQADALARGEVAAVAAPAPWPSLAKTKGARSLLNWKQIQDNGNYYAGVYFTTKKFAAQNPSVLKRFVAANDSLTQSLSKNRKVAEQRTYQAWSKVTRKKLDPGVASAAFKTIKFDSKATYHEFDRVQDISLRVGQVRRKGDLKGFIYGAR